MTCSLNKIARHRNLNAGIFAFAAMLLFSPTGLQGQIPPPNEIEIPEDPAAVIAVVGQSSILLGDLQSKVDAQINQAVQASKREFPESELKAARKGLIRRALVQAIQTKMLKECFLLEQIATQTAEKRAEATEMIQQRAREMFFKNELKKLKEVHGTDDLTELDGILREKGTSLVARQRDFSDAMLGHMYMRSQVNQDPNITIAEINQYYIFHQEEYAHEAQARWEQLSALFKNHPDENSTRKAIEGMGREAFYGGNLQAVAKQKSEEPFAGEGGLHDWTSQGALASKKIDEQVFGIPLNRMSEIIRDDDGLHIIRVLERKPAGVEPLAGVQESIREKLKKEKIAKSQEQMLEKMRDRVPVWSLFHDDMPGANPLPPSLMRRAAAPTVGNAVGTGERASGNTTDRLSR